MDFEPLSDRVLLRRIEAEEEQIGSIIIPVAAKERPQEAVVIAVGPGRMEGAERLPMSVKVGDKVLIGKYSGQDVDIGHTTHTIIREEEILGILRA